MVCQSKIQYNEIQLKYNEIRRNLEQQRCKSNLNDIRKSSHPTIRENTTELKIHTIMWHLPALAHPGPLTIAIHCARRSSLSCLSILPATSRLFAASLA